MKRGANIGLCTLHYFKRFTSLIKNEKKKKSIIANAHCTLMYIQDSFLDIYKPHYLARPTRSLYGKLKVYTEEEKILDRKIPTLFSERITCTYKLRLLVKVKSAQIFIHQTPSMRIPTL